MEGSNSSSWEKMNWFEREEMKLFIKEKCKNTAECENALLEAKKESRKMKCALYMSTIKWHRKNYPGLSHEQINMLLAENLGIMGTSEMAKLIQDHLFRKLEDPENELWKKIDMSTAEGPPIIIMREDERATTSTQFDEAATVVIQQMKMKADGDLLL
uniref:Uncharacterized protein n=1 Tax=Meloidogyne javanica TaxID=6303 RepID=A0A915LH06_MELJA